MGNRNGEQLHVPNVNQFVVTSGASSEPTSESTEVEGVFDPGEYTVPEVLAYIEDHPDEEDAILEAEADGKARLGILGD